MSLSGKLADASVADVMQFVHLGGRTGTLRLSSGELEGTISFHRGRVVHARSPSSRPLSSVLQERGLLTQEGLAQALTRQREAAEHRPIGHHLVELALVTPEGLRESVQAHIEEAVYELAVWQQGAFHFEIDDLQPLDDLGLEAQELIPHIHLNTQLLLMEAMRLFDERNRDGDGGLSRLEARARAGNGREAPTPLAPATSLATPRPIEPDAPTPSPSGSTLIAVTGDRELVSALESRMPGLVVHATQLQAPTEAPHPERCVILLDLRGTGSSPIRILHEARSRSHGSPLLAIPGDRMSTAEVFVRGAVPVPADAAAIAACCELLRPAVISGPDRVSAAMERLRRILGEMRSGLVSATVALSLMNVISESVERAILFVPRAGRLVGLGAFGSACSGRPLAQFATSLWIEASPENLLGRAFHGGRAAAAALDTSGLPERFFEQVGAPRSGQIVAFPVLGQQRVVLVIYADNGFDPRRIDEIDLIDLAAAQAGLAFENELLRRELDDLRTRVRLDERPDHAIGR